MLTSLRPYILKEKIERCINEIQPHLYKTIMENFNKRVHVCQQNVREGHLSDMLFYTLILYHILNESIKNLQFLITNLCFLSKLFLP